MNEIKATALQIAEILDSKKGEEILIIDVVGKASYADFLVIGTGMNTKHVVALADSVEDELAKQNLYVKRKDGHRSGDWVVLDFGDILVHIFVEEKRHFYNIEKMWNDANKIEVHIDTVQ